MSGMGARMMLRNFWQMQFTVLPNIIERKSPQRTW